jgi:MoaA/NifB/PqqE/SkfB family radical SAM enzyme
MRLSILYRGPLSSCNYECGYCPFAKREDPPELLREDEAALSRFVSWAEGRAGDELAVLFTPWGEALHRRWYQQALARLTRAPHVRRAAIQTNLAAGLAWVEECDKPKLALWATYHPSQVARARFVGRCRELLARGVMFSVGVVGLKENLAEAEALRAELPPAVYVWINAYKREPRYYTAEELKAFEAIDPLFAFNAVSHPSLGESCRAGASVISVDGGGTIRRCHFIREPLGNLYESGFERALFDRACVNATCGCHIGYVHLDRLGLGEAFGGGILERIPEGWPGAADALRRRSERLRAETQLPGEKL